MRSTNRQPQQKNKFYFLNFRIQEPTLRVIDNEGKQIGILSKDEALKKAQEIELDLVLISQTAKPPVAKITDFKKFLYQEKKKQQEAKKGIKKSVVKVIKLSLFIAEADVERLVNKGKEFLDAGSQISLNLGLRGREITKRQMAFDLMNKFIADLGDVNISKEPKMEGRVIRAVVARKK